jgi:hypothetical protein
MGGVVLETESERIKRIERCKIIKGMLDRGKTPEEISEFCGFDLKLIQQVKDDLALTV